MATKEEILQFRTKLATDLTLPKNFRTGEPWASPAFIDEYINKLSDERIEQHLDHYKKHKTFGNFPDLDYCEIIVKNIITKEDVEEYKKRLAAEMKKVGYNDEQVKDECSTITKRTLLGGDIYGDTPEEHAHSEYVCY